MPNRNDLEESGVVISYFGNTVSVEGEKGELIQCHLHRNQALPVVGDHVQFKWESETMGSIVAIKERRSVLARGDKRGKMKLLAANIDRVGIVMSPPPVFSEQLIDRYFIATDLLKIKAILILNKIDLLNDKVRAQMEERLSPYRSLYDVFLSTIMAPDGLKGLDDELKGKASVLIGPSGVGKSSIISALTKEGGIRTGEVSAKGSGRHTTTATHLYHLSGGGCLIDSPGVREFNLWPVSQKEILAGFKEFTPYLGKCKFRDCSHCVEPGCAVQKALEEGKISQARFDSYKKLYDASS